MPCNHRFLDWLHLPNALVPWEVNTLIIGTFNPGWQCNNNAGWFYGRTGNNCLWEVLPSIYNEPTLRVPNNNDEWVNFCANKGIAFTDLITTIHDANETNPLHQQLICGNNFSDTAIENNFHQFEWSPITQILIQRSEIQNVYLTRGATGIWGQRWSFIEAWCQQNEKHCASLLTPSGNARFQYTTEMKLIYPTLTGFIKARWIEKWHQL